MTLVINKDLPRGPLEEEVLCFYSDAKEGETIVGTIDKLNEILFGSTEEYSPLLEEDFNALVDKGYTGYIVK